MRRRKFLNLSQDLDFRNVEQDNAQLIAYIQAVHFRLPQPVRSADSTENPVPLLLTTVIAKLFSFKRNGTFVEVGAYRHGRPSNTEWLEKELNWHGLLIQPDPMDYLTLRKHTRSNAVSIHSCVSSTTYPKEITFHQATDGAGELDINEIDQTRHLFARVKCFPLYSLLLAINMTTLDYLSLNAEGSEIEVLRTLPMNRINIEVISISWQKKDPTLLENFLMDYGYVLIQNVSQIYVFAYRGIQ